MARRKIFILPPGDVLVIKCIDRLGRNYADILEQWRHITKRQKACIVVPDMPLLDTRRNDGDLTGALIADIVLQLLSYVAETERVNIRQRQAEGIKAAQARGVRFGRTAMIPPPEFAAYRCAYLNGEITALAASERLGISDTTFLRWVKGERGAAGLLT